MIRTQRAAQVTEPGKGHAWVQRVQGPRVTDELRTATAAGLGSRPRQPAGEPAYREGMAAMAVVRRGLELCWEKDETARRRPWVRSTCRREAGWWKAVSAEDDRQALTRKLIIMEAKHHLIDKHPYASMSPLIVQVSH